VLFIKLKSFHFAFLTDTVWLLMFMRRICMLRVLHLFV